MLVGDIRLDQTDPEHLRRRVGMVTQDVQLFRATVRDNLTFFDARVDDQQIHAVLEELGLTAWVEGLSDGLDTMLEAGGGGSRPGRRNFSPSPASSCATPAS